LKKPAEGDKTVELWVKSFKGLGKKIRRQGKNYTKITFTGQIRMQY
jgi:hypothetical protein